MLWLCFSVVVSNSNAVADNKESGWNLQSKFSNKQILSAAEEDELSEYAIASCKLHFGLNTKQFRCLAYEYIVS